MGRKLVLTGTTITDDDAPILATVDPIESSGSLLLMEPGHPLDTTTGVPANTDAAQNLFAANCTDVTGAAGHPIWYIEDITGGKALFERSTKGGLHCVPSRTLVTYLTVAAILPNALKTYMLAHDTDHYYMSTWLRKTRLEVSTAQGTPMVYSRNSDPYTNYLAWNSDGEQVFAGGSGSVLSGLSRTTGNFRVAIHADAWEGTKPADYSEFFATVFEFCATIFGQAANVLSDYLIYRTYLENLTVSGRTYSEVDALDEALYTQHVLTSGGRYYGDSWTDPATVV